MPRAELCPDSRNDFRKISLEDEVSKIDRLYLKDSGFRSPEPVMTQGAALNELATINSFMMKTTIYLCSLLILLLTFTISSTAATQIELIGPDRLGSFGAGVTILPSGNIVVTDPAYDITSPQTITDAGAVYLYSPSGTLISTITGNCAGDTIGSGGVVVLANGNYLIQSPAYDYANAGGTTSANCLSGNPAQGVLNTNTLVNADTGAVTMGFAATGVSGVVSPANSLVGSFAQDRSGDTITTLPNGNYLVQSAFWNGTRGAVTWRSAAAATSGFITAANSQTGSNPGDFIGLVKVLTNGNYVVYRSNWGSSAGVAALCNQPTGCVGTFSSANALVGAPGDNLGIDGVVALANGNFAVVSHIWNGNRGAVTWGNGTTGTVGQASAANSLVGSTANDFVGSFGVTPLTNGNFVVSSGSWKNGAGVSIGAATFGNGTTGTFGAVSALNSLVGNAGNDFFLAKIVALTNGNYVVSLPRVDIPSTLFEGAAVWGSGTTGVTGNVTTANSLYRGGDGGVVPLVNGNYVVVSALSLGTGAITWGNGTTGITGEVSAANSLVGSTQGDSLGFSGGSTTVTALTNGNYVVSSSSWDNGNIQNAGAVTLCQGGAPTIGIVSSSNSLVGSKNQDQVGFGGAIALTNGNYAVRSYLWDNASVANAGAVTFGNGNTGVTGEVSPLNSLVGSTANDNVGINGLTALPNGNYVVTSFSWSNRGAVTWGNGTTGTTGAVSVTNSVIGSTNDDRVGTLGNNNSVKVYSDSAFTFHSANWNNGSLNDAGAVTLGKANSPVTGEISADNSVRGTVATTGTNLVYDYSPLKKMMVVGSLNSRIVTIFRYGGGGSVFDFDGDGKSDVSIFRPSAGEWWYLKSSTGGNAALQFGTGTDRIVPGDYTGDGKTDIAFFRPSTGEWFILRSEDNSFFSFPFGASGDIPAPNDYDGDGRTDPAVFRPSSGTWFISLTSGGTSIVNFGNSEDKPVAADYDGDGKADIAIFRPSDGSWWHQRSSDGQFRVYQFGTGTDKPVPGDYTGDGRADIAVFRPSTGIWFVQRSEDNSFFSFPFGASGDVPVPGDYDGDGKFDSAVFRPSNATWFLNQTSAGVGIVSFGIAGDQPVPNAFVP
jgi:hypothetical protein